jgi:hypothetical protein
VPTLALHMSKESWNVTSGGRLECDVPTLALHGINGILPGITTIWTRNPPEGWLCRWELPDHFNAESI